MARGAHPELARVPRCGTRSIGEQQVATLRYSVVTRARPLDARCAGDRVRAAGARRSARVGRMKRRMDMADSGPLTGEDRSEIQNLLAHYAKHLDSGDL